LMLALAGIEQVWVEMTATQAYWFFH
jgi:hypothetical protein